MTPKGHFEINWPLAATAKVYLARSAENRSWLINDSTLLTITGLWWRFGVTHMYTQPPPQPQNSSSVLGARHKVERTEGASDKFLIWIMVVNWQLWAVLKKMLWANYEQLLNMVFSCFQGQKKSLKFFKKHFSVRTKKLHKINFIKKNFELKIESKYDKNRLNRGIWIQRVRIDRGWGGICSFWFVVPGHEKMGKW